MNGNSFLSETLLVGDINVAGSAVFDTKDIKAKTSDICIVLIKSAVSAKITSIKVEHCDTEDGTFEELTDSTNGKFECIKEQLPLDNGLKYQNFGIKADQLKRFIKITATANSGDVTGIIISNK